VSTQELEGPHLFCGPHTRFQFCECGVVEYVLLLSTYFDDIFSKCVCVCCVSVRVFEWDICVNLCLDNIDCLEGYSEGFGRLRYCF
jgi:hypothetical protein